MNIDAGEFRALTGHVEALAAEVAHLREQVTQATFGHMLAVVTADMEAFERGRASVSRPPHPRRSGPRPGHLRLAGEGGLR